MPALAALCPAWDDMHYGRGSTQGRIMVTLRWKRLGAVRFAALLLLAAAVLPGAAFAGALDRIRHDNVIRIAYRADAPPFSFSPLSPNSYRFVR